MMALHYCWYANAVTDVLRSLKKKKVSLTCTLKLKNLKQYIEKLAQDVGPYNCWNNLVGLSK